MPAIAYSVAAIIPNEPLAQRYIAWLEDGHIDQVVKAGAHSAMIVRVVDPPTPIRVETRYIFANREVFDSYVLNHAPALRADGLRLFPPDSGIRFERSIAEVL